MCAMLTVLISLILYLSLIFVNCLTNVYGRFICVYQYSLDMKDVLQTCKYVTLKDKNKSSYTTGMLSKAQVDAIFRITLHIMLLVYKQKG